MQELMDQAGYGNMQKKVDKVQARIKILEKLVSTDRAKGSISHTLDPERSCFVTNPPRQFPSKTALDMFLSEHPEIKEKHDKLTASGVSTATAEPTAPAVTEEVPE
jgi:hypothetical protein